MKKIYDISRFSLAAIFLYHGVVPKLWFKSSQEVLMNSTMMPAVPEQTALLVSGVLEVILALLFIVLYNNQILNYLAIAFIAGVSVGILIYLPHLYTLAFNPFSLNLSVIVLAVINIMTHPGKQSP